jgi:hypothetical protein
MHQGSVAGAKSAVKVSLWVDQSANGPSPYSDISVIRRYVSGTMAVTTSVNIRIFFAKKSGFYFALEMDVATMNGIRPTGMGWFVASRTPRTFSTRTWLFFESGLE